jgi:hypothetical protein
MRKGYTNRQGNANFYTHKKIIKTAKHNAGHIRRILTFNTLGIAPVYLSLSSSTPGHRARSQHTDTHTHTHDRHTDVCSDTHTRTESQCITQYFVGIQ